MTQADTERTHLTVTPSEDGLRLDQLLVSRFSRLGRRGAARLIADGGVRLAHAPGSTPAKSTPVQAGEVILLRLTDQMLARARPTDAPPMPRQHTDVTIVFQDDHLTVLLKPAGRPTHPLTPEDTDTVANHLAWADPLCLTAGGPPREGGLCHRLDRLTSGLLVAARTPEAHRHLRAVFAAHEVDKGYLALVSGDPPDQGKVDVPIASARGRRRVRVGSGQPALTRYQTQERFVGLALVEVTTNTGRRHQVRAHLAHADHPLVDDTLYGGSSVEGWSAGPLLHAHRLALAHPVDGHALRFTAPLLPQQRRALDALAEFQKQTTGSEG
jgi:23S rRNA pseudouridine1911/1915/1917 synthase